MSRRGVIEATPPDKCELCGEIAELRPYGPNNENICYPCGMKDEKAAEKKFNEVVLGEYIT